MNKAATNFARAAAPATTLAHSRSRKKRFLLVGTAALAAIGVAMGVSFLDNSGAATVSISPGSSNLVYPAAASWTLPTGSDGTKPLTTTAFSGKATLAHCTNITVSFTGTATDPLTATQTAGGYDCSSNDGNDITSTASGKLPSWSPVSGTAGTVTQSGDLAVVDATSATNYVTVNLYVTNLPKLLVNYASFALPINVYKTQCTSSGCSAWTQSDVVSTANFGSYLTDTSGQLTFSLPAGYYYDITMEGTDHTLSSGTNSPNNTAPAWSSTGVGGSYAVSQIDTTNGDLGPTFFFTATTS